MIDAAVVVRTVDRPDLSRSTTRKGIAPDSSPFNNFPDRL